MQEVIFKKVNNLLAWLAFGISAIVYMLTLEPTTSLWDSGQFIAIASKLQVGHPPGAPLYQIMGRIFSLFSFGEASQIAFWVNTMSAVFAALAVSLLFRTITILARKLLAATNELSLEKVILIFGSAMVGSLAFAFSDSFWFSAVEAEVYTTSMFFTAFVFWSILKWEQVSHEKDSLKWLVGIAYIIGLSIGVHMLNLLAIPAIVYVYYFKKFQPTTKGIILTGLLSFALVGFVMSIFIPGVLVLDWWFELFFVNVLGLPFNVGSIFFFVLLIAFIAFAIYYSHRHKKVILNTVVLAFTFILIGYSTYFMLVVRSNAYVPINQNAPKDALAMQAYLGREQYGEWPLLSGPHYNSPIIDFKDGNPGYGKNLETGRYEVINYRRGFEPVFHPDFITVFPRMWSRASQLHINGYETWGNVEGRPVRFINQEGEQQVVNKPTLIENLRFFIGYQVGHMYWRYFMWNFAGRQNDIQGHGSPIEGNWLTGINFIDELRLGPQDNLPDSFITNPGYNRYFMLPLVLGIIGMLFQLRRRPNDSLVVAALFFMTGLAIILYLNQTPFQPRERDYSYIGSFYAFSIWVGLGVLGIYNYLSKKVRWQVAVSFAVMASMMAAPVLMASENWDGNDRSGRYVARDIAKNYLNSLAPNAIIFTMGDNDTFPLWYAREVEGIRRDVKVVNLSLLNTDWYINYMTRRKTFDAAPLPFTMDPIKYRDGTRDFVHLIENPALEGYQDLGSIMRFVASDDPRTQIRTTRGMENFIPTKNFRLQVDSARVVENGTVAPEDAHLIVPAIEWRIDEFGIHKNQLMVLDFLVANNWERPVYFAITIGHEGYFGLEEHFQLEGMAYRLVPIRTRVEEGQPGHINTRILYDNLMNKFVWGNMYDPDIYMNEDKRRLSVNFKNIFQRLAHTLIAENKMDSAIAVLDRAIEIMPASQVPFNYFTLMLAEGYFKAGQLEKGTELAVRMVDYFSENLEYYFRFTGNQAAHLDRNKQEALAILQRIGLLGDSFGLEDLSQMAKTEFDTYYQLYIQGM
ncbi:MAG TPA: DUF2723 domain-containing protein [Bacteroidales bacterium]|nr:DUF2723 domain-containing protein [Bacteroidales bacterium]